MLSAILTAATIGFSAGVTPGPLQAVFLAYAVKGGWKKALPAAFAPLVTDGPVIVLVLLVLNNLRPMFLRALQIGGAFFLLYLAYDAYRSFKQYKTVEEAEETSGWGTLLKAALMNLLAPGPWLFWSLINGPNLLRAWSVSPWQGTAYIGTFYGVFILSNIGLILLFGAMRKMGERVRKSLLLVSAVVLAGFAVYQGLQGFGIL